MTRPIANLADVELVSLVAMSAKAGGAAPPPRFGGRMARIARVE